MQWLRWWNTPLLVDRQTVRLMNTMHTANKHIMAKRRVKQNDVWKEIATRKPKLVDDYNQRMLRVDKSDHLIGSYNILMKYVQWWKSLVFSVHRHHMCQQIHSFPSWVQPTPRTTVYQDLYYVGLTPFLASDSLCSKIWQIGMRGEFFITFSYLMLIAPQGRTLWSSEF